MPRMQTLLQAYKAGEISKHDFISAMYGSHELLFAYAQRLAEVNLSEISLRPEGITMTFKEPPVRLLCPQGDTRIAPIEALNFGDYEKAELRAVHHVLSHIGGENAHCLDIGANVGFYSLAMTSWFSGLSVDAFEPIPNTYLTLVNNLGLNVCGRRVHAHNIGLSDKNGEWSFFTYPSHSEAASMTQNLDSQDVCEVRCQVRQIDELNLTADFIKCDVEGAELFVFKGAEKLLTRDRPAIFTEMLRKWCAQFNYHPNDIIRYLGDLGYVCMAVGSSGLRHCPEVTSETVETNYFFFHHLKHASLLSSPPSC